MADTDITEDIIHSMVLKYRMWVYPTGRPCTQRKYVLTLLMNPVRFNPNLYECFPEIIQKEHYLIH